jgi:IS30 family transposase
MKRASFVHLKDRDRDRIQALYLWGHQQKHIAEIMNIDPGTVSRELNRYGKKTWRYSAVRAQKDAKEKREHSKRPGMKIEATPALKAHIIAELEHLRSPDEIAGRMRKDGVLPRVGKNAIYMWLYSSYGKEYTKHLCTKRPKSRKQNRFTKRELIPNRKSHRTRPVGEGLVHAEGDLFVSPTRLKVTTSGLLVVVPEVHLLHGMILPNKKSAVMVSAMQSITDLLPLDTCTFDNGIENVHHADFGVDAYFCDRGSPWQKPHVESSIGLIRRWFLAKGTDLSQIPDALFQSQLALLNHKYRKSLGYMSAYEAALARGIIQEVPEVSLEEAIAFR